MLTGTTMIPKTIRSNMSGPHIGQKNIRGQTTEYPTTPFATLLPPRVPISKQLDAPTFVGGTPPNRRASRCTLLELLNCEKICSGEEVSKKMEFRSVAFFSAASGCGQLITAVKLREARADLLERCLGSRKLRTKILSDLASSLSMTGSRDWRPRDVGRNDSQCFDEDPQTETSEKESSTKKIKHNCSQCS